MPAEVAVAMALATLVIGIIGTVMTLGRDGEAVGYLEEWRTRSDDDSFYQISRSHDGDEWTVTVFPGPMSNSGYAEFEHERLEVAALCAIQRADAGQLRSL